MRLRVLDIASFGALRGVRFELDPTAAVVFGPNEAGKSSFHGAVETALYGFSPASREAHPYSYWDEDENLELSAELDRTDGTTIAVERTLRATPGTRIAESIDQLSGPRRGNSPLPGLEPFPRPLFRAVYSLTANDTTFQKDEVREHIRELLCGERGLENVRSTREVRVELANEMGALWRPGERGKPRARILRADLRAAQRREREARKRERSLREEAVEQADLMAERDELDRLRRALRREDAIADFLEAIAELRGRMDGVEPLRDEGLGGSSMEDPGPLAEELAAITSELSAPRTRLAVEKPRLGLSSRMVLTHASEIEGVLREAGTQDSERGQLAAARERAQGAERGARERLDRVGTAESNLECFERLDLSPLEAALETWKAESARVNSQVRTSVPARSLLLVALTCLVLAATGFAPPLVALGSLVAIPAVLRRDKSASRTPAPEGLTALLAEIGLGPVHSPPELQRALTDLGDARSLLCEVRREVEDAVRLEREIEQRGERWKKIAEKVLESAEEASGLPQVLERALAQAKEQDVEVRSVLEHRARDEEHIAAHRTRERRLTARVQDLHAVLAANFPTLTPREGYAAWLETERELEYVRRREQELRKDDRWEEFAGDPRLGLEGDERPWSQAARADRETEQARLDARLEELRERRGEIGVHLDEDRGSAVAEAAEDVAQIERELRATLRGRDRLALLERVLIVAERAHREAHQPDILARAGEYLARITGGRYTGLCYPDGGEEVLCVQASTREEPVPVEVPLSRGTREQIYLCLRLGTLDDLDKGREKLPLILDEALVHWDPERRSALYPVLAQVAQRRQVIVFTCHPELAEEAAEGLGAARIELGASASSDL